MGIEQSKQQWRERASGGYFFGKSIAGLDRDELLAIIGCLIESAELDRQQRSSQRETWAALSKV
jgi:hypothetical protein